MQQYNLKKVGYVTLTATQLKQNTMDTVEEILQYWRRNM